MRVHIMSDLHLEFAPFQPYRVDADVIVLAGDVHTGENGIKWILQTFPDRPVIYVLGNHEFYGQKLQKLISSLRACLKSPLRLSEPRQHEANHRQIDHGLAGLRLAFVIAAEAAVAS